MEISELAVNDLALLYRGSFSFAAQPDRLRVLLRNCAKGPQSSPRAQFTLALQYRMGDLLQKDFTKAAKYYLLAAKDPHPSGQPACSDAMAELACFYAHGLGGLAPDYERAEELCQRACGCSDLHDDRRELCRSVRAHIARVKENSSSLTMAGDAWDPCRPLRFCDRPECVNQESYDREFKVCAGCNDVAYCSRQCQKSDWPRHKLVCNRSPED